MDTVGQPEPGGLSEELRPAGAVAGQHDVAIRRQIDERLDQYVVALDPLQPPDAPDQAGGGRQPERPSRVRTRTGAEAIGIHPVRNDYLRCGAQRQRDLSRGLL